MSVCAAGSAHAGAWTQKKGEGLFIDSASYYRASEFINNAGKRQSQPLYQKVEWNPYIEYGLTDSITLGANLFVQYVRQQTSYTYSFSPTPFTTITTTIDGDRNNIGIGDSEFFLRKRLWQKDGFVLSAEPMVKAPALWYYNDLPAIGNKRADVGLTLSGGYGFSAYGQNHFANLDTGYRYRFGDQKDQVRIAATLGIGIDEQWTIMPQLFITHRTGTAAPPLTPTGSFNENPANDYNLTKVQLSAICRMWDDTTLQFGGFYHVDAKNSSTGGGVLLALWENF